jgi:glycosyltransferase involved in cell wall biosynthesis
MNPPVLFVALQTGALANGGLQSLTELIGRLKAHRPIVLTNLASDLAGSWRSLGIEVHIVPEEASTGLKRHPIATVRTYRRYHGAVADILSKSGARVVHANDPLAFQLSLSAVKLARRARISLNVRGTLDPDRRPPNLKYRLIFAAADHVFFLSNEMAERWRQVAPNATRACSVTYSIADSGRFWAAPPAENIAPAVLLPGIFSPGKSQLEFIRNAVPALAKAGVEAWFAGDFDPAANSYAAACAAAADPFKRHVKFLGYRKDVPDLIRQAGVVAVPSRHEGLMRGMIEAMSCGRPVVSFDVCSAREILEQQAPGAGTVVRSGDYAAMAQAIVRYATDRDAQAAAGQAGSACARELFDAERVVDRYERVYTELGRR